MIILDMAKSHRVTSELYYENFNKIYSKLESNASKNIYPAEYDIFITKHIKMTNYDSILNMFLTTFSNQYSENNLNKLKDSKFIKLLTKSY